MKDTCILIVVVAFLATSTVAQEARLGSASETIYTCYRNMNPHDREMLRQSMHIENLIGIIRKIEDYTNHQWDMRRISRLLINNFMFEGIRFYPGNAQEYQYQPHSKEAAKTSIVKSFIPMNNEEMLPSILSEYEKCALHMMLSHSLNDTELEPDYYYNGGSEFDSGSGWNNGQSGSGSGWNNGQGGSGSGWNNGQAGSGSGWYNGQGGSGSNWDSGQSGNGWPRKKRSLMVEDNTLYGEHSIDQDRMANPAAAYGDVEMLPNIPNDSSKNKMGNYRMGRQTASSGRRVESGVVYTKWGSVAAGRVISGIASALEPLALHVQTGTFTPYSGIPGSPSFDNNGGYGSWDNNNAGGGGSWGNNNGGSSGYPGRNNNDYNPGQPGNQYSGRRRKRQINSYNTYNYEPLIGYYAVTLAGDAGQAAILNAQHNVGGQPNADVPKGQWNRTTCPRNYVVNVPYYSQDSDGPTIIPWSYMTEAEIRGGVDGLILAENLRDYDPRGEMRLSELLSKYYSDQGVRDVTLSRSFRACDRQGLYQPRVNMQQQVLSFAYWYNNKTSALPIDVDNMTPFNNLIDKANNKLNSVIGTLNYNAPACKQPAGGSQSDDMKTVETRAIVWAVIDHSDTYEGIQQQYEFFGALAEELDVEPRGSRLGLVDGASGHILISPNFTHNSAELQCEILLQNIQVKQNNMVNVLDRMRSEIENYHNLQERQNISWGDPRNSLVILYMMQGTKPSDSVRDSFYDRLVEFDYEFGDVHVIFASSRYSKSEFTDFLLDDDDFVELQRHGNLSDSADKFVEDLGKTLHFSLKYQRCDIHEYEDQSDEYVDATTFFVTPGTIQYYMISPSYCFKSRVVALRLTSTNGRVRACLARQNKFPLMHHNGTEEDDNEIYCYETTGTFVPVGSNEVDVQFLVDKPCRGYKREDCEPIYMSVTTINGNGYGQGAGLDCQIEGCESGNQVKVVVTHWGMRCSGVKVTTMISVVIFSLLISFFCRRLF